MYPKSDWIDVAQLLNWMDGMDHRAGWGIEHLTELKKVQWLLIHFKTFLFNCILSQDLCVHFCLVASCEYFMFGCIFILRDFCVGCIFTGDLLCWLHLHWRLEGFATCHLSPQIAQPGFALESFSVSCIHRVYVLRVCVYTICTFKMYMYTPCAHIVCTYVCTVCTYCVYIRIHPVHVLHIHMYCLGGVLVEGLRIRLTSDYSVEAAPGRDGYISLYTTAC